MATAISTFYPSLRHILGDIDSDSQKYEDASLLVGVQTIIRCGKLSDYTLSTDSLSVEPDVTDPNDYALVLYHTAHSFIAPKPDAYAFRTRALSQSVSGATRDFLRTLEENIYSLENGEMFDSWQHLDSWLKGMTGVNLLTRLTEVTSVENLNSITIPAS